MIITGLLHVYNPSGPKYNHQWTNPMAHQSAWLIHHTPFAMMNSSPKWVGFSTDSGTQRRIATHSVPAVQVFCLGASIHSITISCWFWTHGIFWSPLRLCLDLVHVVFRDVWVFKVDQKSVSFTKPIAKLFQGCPFHCSDTWICTSCRQLDHFRIYNFCQWSRNRHGNQPLYSEMFQSSFDIVQLASGPSQIINEPQLIGWVSTDIFQHIDPTMLFL